MWCCGPTGVAGVACAVRRAGLLGVPVGGGLSAFCLWPRQISGRRTAASNWSGCLCVVRPGPAGLAAASNRSGCLCVVRPVPPPPTGTAAGLADLLLVAPLVFRAPDGPAAREARRPHFVRRRASKPGQAPQASRRPPIGRGACVLSGQAPPTPVDTAGRPSPSRRTRIQWSLPTFLSPPPISHAIPLRLFQTMNLQRWNCNVFRLY